MSDVEIKKPEPKLSKTDLELKKTELEVAELEFEGTRQFQSQMAKVAGFAGAELLFSGTILSAFRPPLVQTPFLLTFYAFSVVAVLLSGAAIVLGKAPIYRKIRVLAGSFSIYALLLSLVALGLFAFSNYMSDWRETPLIANVSIDKGIVDTNEPVSLEVSVVNPNQTEISYVWQSDTGEFIDGEGTKAIWKAPSAPGTAVIIVAVVPGHIPQREIPRADILRIAETFDRREFAINVRPQQSKTTPERLSQFVPRCTDALDKAYNGNLAKSGEPYEAAAIICASASQADEAALNLDDKYIAQQAKLISAGLPMNDLPKVLAMANAKRPQSTWDKRPCCNESDLLWPFCKVFSKECSEDPNRLRP